jgi:hypothetical protein
VVRSRMPRILVIHGAGMNMRGKVHVDVFGPMTLAGFGIAGYALALRGIRDQPAAKRGAWTMRAIVVAGMLSLLTTGFGETRALALSATPVGELRVEWETVARGERAVVRGYVYNEHQLRAENVRLRIEQLDANARPVATRIAWVIGTIPYRDRGYFEAAVPMAAAAYRVSIESFDRAGCGNG